MRSQIGIFENYLVPLQIMMRKRTPEEFGAARKEAENILDSNFELNPEGRY